MAIKVLIVDDSALMRRQLTQLFEEAGDFVIRQARNGREAVDENIAFEPDVITLDINMPEMDGLTALAHIMAARPARVVMVSSLTEKGALATFEAMALGAIDYVAKPGGTISLSIDQIKIELVNKVRQAARARIRTMASRVQGLGDRLKEEREQRPSAKATVKLSSGKFDGLVLIGVSTGGPSTLESILPRLPADFPYPVVIAQHMPASFTGPFAYRIDKLCNLTVVEVAKPMEVAAGYIYLGKGATDVVLTSRSGRLMVMPKPESPSHLWHPSVELLGRSALEHFEPAHIIGVMLTGMGNDGSHAFAEIKRRGGRTIAESEESAVVFGMPKELIELGGATLVLPVDKIATQLIGWTRHG
jgi:two-component system, chemotaxis family, protein-glutamate methylesterase/glutaminase